jgi:hypothetical protein
MPCPTSYRAAHEKARRDVVLITQGLRRDNRYASNRSATGPASMIPNAVFITHGSLDHGSLALAFQKTRKQNAKATAIPTTTASLDSMSAILPRRDWQHR